MVHFLAKKWKKSQRGQTSVEYILLIAVAFSVAFLLMTKQFSSFTTQLLTQIRGGVGNVIQNGEWSSETIEAGNPKHPSSPKRLQPVHL